jgi:hypothetical protein
MLSTINKFQYLLVAILVFVLALANVVPVAAEGTDDPTAPPTSPIIVTDKLDYTVGETALISGAGFVPNELVKLQIQHTNVVLSEGNGHMPWIVAADTDGRLTSNWYVDPDDSMDSTFTLTADSESGLHAEFAFADPPATTITLNSVFTGWFDTSGFHNAANPNYAAGDLYDIGYRNFFVFDLANVSGQITSAYLYADEVSCGYGSPSTYTLYDVSTPIPSLTPTQSGATSIFDDLGSGTALGSVALLSVNPPYNVPLNVAGIAAINSVVGGNLALGGRYSGPSGGIIMGCSGTRPVKLVLQLVNNQPPSASAGGPYNGTEGSAIAISGASASDPDGDTLTYSWGVDSALCSFDYPNTLNPNLTCTDNGSLTATLTVSDNINTAVTSDASVTISNVAPTASLGNDSPIGEGGSAVLSFSGASDPSSGDTGAGFHYAFDCNGGSLAAATYATSGTGDSTSCAFADNGSYIVSGKIVDKDNGATEYTTVVTVNNLAPTIAISGATNVNEGSPYSLTLGAITDPGTDTVASYIVHWGDGNTDSYSSNGVQTHTYADGPNSYTITVDLTDEDGTFLNRANALSVTVDNVAPTLGGISVDQALVPVGASINTSASFTDPGTLDTHIAVWNWGDSTTSAGTISETGGNGTASDSHSYGTSGVFTLRLTVTDKDGAASNESVYQYVVVYDPNGGLVTGSGWINSPAGAYASNPSLTGKVIFSFVAKYKKGQSTPDGNIEFQFKAGDLHFHSSCYQWLMVAGKKAKLKAGDLHFQSSSYQWLVVAGKKAQIKGEGTINRRGHYGFMLTVIDGKINGRGGVDKFRLRIWDMDNGNAVVYDNEMGAPVNADPTTALGGGNIVIHK